MKIIISESSDYKIEDTIIGAIVQSQSIGALVDTLLLDEFKYRDLYVGYEGEFGKKKFFIIYSSGLLNDSDYCAFTNHKLLYDNIDLLSDCYDITIMVDKSDCFIKVVNKKKEISRVIRDFLLEFRDYDCEGEKL